MIMFCGKCGAELPDNAVICSYCGESVSATVGAAADTQSGAAGYNAQPAQQPPTYQQNYAQPNNGYTDQYQSQMNNATFNTGLQNVYPMKWYKFLIYFSLFAGAVLNFISGIMCMNGTQYEGDGITADMVYAFYDGLKETDMIFGIACIVSAVLLIYTRFLLAGYKRNAPMMVTVSYAFTCVASLIYVIAVSVILSNAGIDASETISSEIPSLIGAAVMIVVNYIYFNKRKALFVN